MTSWTAAKRRLHSANPKLREEYDRLGPRFEIINALIAGREKQGLTQSEVAARMGVRPHVVSRLESALHSPRLETLVAYARALGFDLRVGLSRSTGKGARGNGRKVA
jgi:ribosome-binding protein aMBF1 (putative translation factor)